MATRILARVALAAAPLLSSADTIRLTQGHFPSQPQPRVTLAVDGTWTVLDELMTAGAFYAPIFTYTSATPVQLDVTDLFVVSDQNEVYLNGVLLGATPLMPDWQALSPPVGPLDDPPYTANPAVAWTRPEFSKQSFALPAGTHMLTFRNTHIPLDPSGNPFADGTVAFRLIPEPTSCVLLLAGTLLFRRRRGVGDRLRALAARAGAAPRSAATCAAALMLALAAPFAAQAGTPCGPLTADVVGGVLEIAGTTGPDSIRVARSAGNPAVIEVFSPATAVTPGCSFDSGTTPFGTIRVLADDGDDLHHSDVSRRLDRPGRVGQQPDAIAQLQERQHRK